MLMNIEPRTSPIEVQMHKPLPGARVPPPFMTASNTGSTPRRQTKRKNSDSIGTLINLKRSLIDSSAAFSSTRWSNMVRITSTKRVVDTSPEISPHHDPVKLDDETDFHGDLRLDPLLTFVNNSMETTKETILTQLIDGPLGEVFDQKLARELITNVQYELTLLYLFVHEQELFERNEGLCDNATKIMIDQLKVCAITEAHLSDILLLIVTVKAPKAWRRDDNKNKLTRLQTSTQRKLQHTMTAKCSNQLSTFVNLQIRLIPQLKELASRWATASLSNVQHSRSSISE